MSRTADSPLVACRGHSAPPLLGSRRGMGYLGFCWSYADNFGVLARGANCTNVHLEHLFAGVKKASLDVHDIAHASRSADVLGYEVSPANSYCGGAGKRISRMSSVGRTVSSRRRISGRAMELANVTSLSWRSATVGLFQSLMQAASLRGRLV